MIFNQKANQRRYAFLLAISVIVLLAISGYVIRRQIHQTIIEPLVTKAQLQANFLENMDLNPQNITEIESSLDPFNQLDGGSTVILHNDEVLWNDFSDPARLKQLRKQLQGVQSDQVTNNIFLNNYLIQVPIRTSNGSLQLIKYYERSLFKVQLHQFYIWMAGIVLLIIITIFTIYKLLLKYFTKPVESLKVAIEHIEDEDYFFEYIPGNTAVVDELGESVVSLKEELLKKRNNLNDSEQRLTLLMGHLNLGVVLINNAGKIELINYEAMQLLNIDSQSTQRSYQAVIKSYVLVDMINDALKTHRPLNNDIEMYVPTSKYIDVNIIPYGKSEDEIESILVLLYDISQIRRLETVRTEFVANASHELRTPVTAIKGFAETLLDGALAQPDLAEKFLTIIANESNRLEVIINDILELSRVEKKSEPMMIRAFEIGEVVNHLIQFFYKRADKKHINITVEAPEPIMMETDQHRVEQIFTNLIDNAINYSDVDSEIHIDIKKVDDYVHFSVSDTGIGIPEADQERIFERFYRVDKGRSRNSGGTGLGLSIVRNLVRNMSGTIYVESEVGEGSTFHVELPLRSIK